MEIMHRKAVCSLEEVLKNFSCYHFRQEGQEAKNRSFFPLYESGFFILSTENKAIFWAAAPVLSKIIYLPALQKTCCQEKNQSPVGAGKLSFLLVAPLGPCWRVGSGLSPPSPGRVQEEQDWK